MAQTPENRDTVLLEMIKTLKELKSQDGGRRSKPREAIKSAATLLVELVAESGAKIILDQYRNPFFVLPSEWTRNVGNVSNEGIPYKLLGVRNKEDAPILDSGKPSLPTLPTLPGKALGFNSRKLSAILSNEFYKLHGKVPGPESIKSALRTIEGMNISNPSVEFWNRVGVDERGDWWLDLSDGRYVWITVDGWEVFGDTPLFFRRYGHQLPMHEPRREGEGDLFSLLDFAKLPDPDSQLLYLICALQTLIPRIPKAALCIVGEPGSVKTTAQAAIVEIFDKTTDKNITEGLLALHDDMKQLVQNLDHHWICYFDNLGRLSKDQSDALCRAVTGGGIENRVLYTDDDDMARRLRRCIGWNSVGLLVQETDLMSRTVFLEGERISKVDRKTDEEITAHLYRVAPRILGDALSVVCRAKSMMDTGFRLKEKPRMADFATWGEALSRCMGFEPGVFLNAYQANIRDATLTVATTNIVGGLLIDYLKNRLSTISSLTFTVHELYSTLREKAKAEGYGLREDFPQDPPRLGVMIRGLASSLPSAGFSLRMKRTSRGSEMTFSRYVPTKLDELIEFTPGFKGNVWGVSDLRELRGNLKALREEVNPEAAKEVKPLEVKEIVTEPSVETPPAVVKPRVELEFAREAVLMYGPLVAGERVSLEALQDMLVGLGLGMSAAVKIISGLGREEKIVFPAPGWVVRVP